MRKIKIRDIIFWILILAAIGIAIWLVIGSPTIETGLLMIVIFIAASEIVIWKTLFKIDKKTCIGFIKIKNEMHNKFVEVNNNLNEIKLLIKEKKK